VKVKICREYITHIFAYMVIFNQNLRWPGFHVDRI